MEGYTLKMELLDLPTELRDYIYALVVQQHEPIRLPYHTSVAPFTTISRPPEPALLAVNRQIRMEAMSVFYGDNVFRCSRPDTARSFLRELNECQIKRLRKLEILFGPSSPRIQADLHQLGSEFSGRGLRKEAVWMRVPFRHGSPWSRLTDMRRLEVVESGPLWVVEWKAEYGAKVVKAGDAE